MKPPPTAKPAQHIDDDQLVPDDLIGRLYRATESSVFELLPDLSPQDRAYLAMFCYRKSHLHRIGLAIAATCDETVLVQTWGTALGQTLYARSREEPPKMRPAGPHRPKITLASLSGSPLPADVDEDEDDDEDGELGVSVPLN